MVPIIIPGHNQYPYFLSMYALGRCLEAEPTWITWIHSTLLSLCLALRYLVVTAWNYRLSASTIASSAIQNSRLTSHSPENGLQM